MNQLKLYKTIESFANKNFEAIESLLSHVLNQIVQSDRIEIQGGRVWKFNPVKFAYELITQISTAEKIKSNFTLKVDEYKLFKQLPIHRTIIANETNHYLRSKGIKKFAATGVGETVTVKDTVLFPYILSFDTTLSHEQLAATLNIISVAITTLLKNKFIERKTAQLQEDLNKAREIQRSILPEHELFFHNYEIFGVSVADRSVGGDFFDYILSEEDDRVGIVIGDAASKGLSAAVQALYVSGALRMGAGYQTKISSLIRRINALVHRTFPDERFLTLFYAELIDDKQGLCVYVNAGHVPPILYRAKTKEVELIQATGQIIGPFPNEKYSSESVMVNKGDILLMYTDGVSEAMDVEGTFYSEDRIIKKLLENKECSAKDITRSVLEDVQRFNAKSKYSDDKTIVVIKRVK